MNTSTNSARVMIMFSQLLRLEFTPLQYMNILEHLSNINDSYTMSDFQILSIALSMIFDLKLRTSILTSLGYGEDVLREIDGCVSPLKIYLNKILDHASKYMESQSQPMVISDEAPIPAI